MSSCNPNVQPGQHPAGRLQLCNAQALQLLAGEWQTHCRVEQAQQAGGIPVGQQACREAYAQSELS